MNHYPIHVRQGNLTHEVFSTWTPALIPDRNSDLSGGIFLSCMEIHILIFSKFNPIDLGKTKIVYNFGLSECNRVINL